MNTKSNLSPVAGHRAGASRARSLGLVLVLLAVPAVVAGQKSPGNEEVSSEMLVWPQPPQRARVRFVAQIASASDVTGKKQKKQSWMDRLAGVKQRSVKSTLHKPYGVAVDSHGRIYVADSGNRTVLVFDRANQQFEQRGNRAPARLALPVGVAVDDRDRLFVSDAFLHQVSCFGPEGNLLGVFGQRELGRPGGIAVDSVRRRLYAADAKAHRIAVFNIDTFGFLNYIGERSREREPGKFAAPTNVAVDSKGFLYVTDTWNHRVQIFNAEGRFVRAFGEHGDAPGNFVRPKGIAVDSEGHVYVADSEFNNFQILSPEGQPLLAIGATGTGPGQFALIAGLAIDRQDRIYVTEQWQPRLQIFQFIPEGAALEAGLREQGKTGKEVQK